MPSNKNGVGTSNRDTITPIDLFETIQEKNYALRAFGALLSTAKLSDFDSDNYCKDSQGKFEAEYLQHGLSKLLDLYLADQEQVIESYADEYRESDEYLLERASSLVKMAEEGAFVTGHIPRDNFYRALENLEIVIARTPIFNPMAEAIKASIIKYAPPEAKKIIQQEVA